MAEEGGPAYRPRQHDDTHEREDRYEWGYDPGRAEERFRAGSRWDRDRRESERAPGRAHDDYYRQDDGHAYGFVRHERRYDDEPRGWRDESRREDGTGFRESASGAHGYGQGHTGGGYGPGMSPAHRGGARGDQPGRGFRGRGPKDYRRSDERIREDVCDRLIDDDTVDARGISVEVAEGEVTLNGLVPSRQAKRVAEDCAEECSGVTHVQNNLRVRETGGDGEDGSQDMAGTGGTATGGRSRSKDG